MNEVLLGKLNWRFHTEEEGLSGNKSKDKVCVFPRWRCPPQGTYKLNSDGACSRNEKASSGGTIRDHWGNWVTGYVRNIGLATSYLAELWALRDGLEVAQTNNLTPLQVEIDSKVVIELIFNDSINNNHAYVAIIHDCRELEECMKELNQHGFSAMHLAAANGHFEVVKEFLEVSHEFCSLKGKDGLTPLHCASIKGRVGIIVQLSSASPACVSEVTTTNETAIHLAMKNSRLDALTTLLDVIKNNNMLEVLNAKDGDGNTALHLAAARRNSQAIQLLVNCNQGTTPGDSALQVNASNNKGLTALDLFLLCPCEFGNCTQVETLLRHAGGGRTQVIPESITSQTHIEILPTPPNPSLLLDSESLEEYFKFQYGRDNPNDVRNSLLVVIVLMATAAFQAVLTLPGRVHQDGDKAGQSLLASQNEFSCMWFVVFNTAGFSTSLVIIIILTYNFPMFWELYVAILAIMATYDVALVATMAPGYMRTTSVALTVFMPALVTYTSKWLRSYFRWRRGGPAYRHSVSV